MCQYMYNMVCLHVQYQPTAFVFDTFLIIFRIHLRSNNRTCGRGHSRNVVDVRKVANVNVFNFFGRRHYDQPN